MKLKLNKLQPLFLVIKREFKLMTKSHDLRLICFLAPIFYGLLFAYLYGNRRASDIPIGIINLDNSAISRKYIRNIEASPDLRVDKTYSSTKEAYIGIFENDLGAFYFIPKDFSSNLKKGFAANAFNATNSSSFIIVSNVIKNMNLISNAFARRQFAKILVDKGYSYEAAISAYTPVRTDTHYIYNPQMNYSDFILPFLVLAVVQQIILVSIATTFSSEKTKKTYKQLCRCAKNNPCFIILGKTIPYILLGLALNIFNALIILPIDAIFVQSLSGYFLLSTFFVIAITFFAVLISYAFTSPELAMAVLMFYAMPAVLLSGIVWPHHALPLILRIISYLIPSTYAFNELRNFILGDVSVVYAIVPCLFLIFLTGVFFAGSWYFEKKSVMRAKSSVVL